MLLRVYSHQESPLVHLLWSGPNTMLIFFVWCSSLSHCSFCKWTRNCKQNHTCAKVFHSLGHPFNHTRVHLEVDRDHLFSWVLVRLFGAHQSAIGLLYSHLPKGSTPRGETNLSLIQSNQTRQVWIHPKYEYFIRKLGIVYFYVKIEMYSKPVWLLSILSIIFLKDFLTQYYIL